jgi:hypothetical protein
VTAEVFTLARSDHGLLLAGPCGAAPWCIEASGEHPLETVRRIVEGALEAMAMASPIED